MLLYHIDSGKSVNLGHPCWPIKEVIRMGWLSGTIHLIGLRRFKVTPTFLSVQLDPKTSATCRLVLGCTHTKEYTGSEREIGWDSYLRKRCLDRWRLMHLRHFHDFTLFYPHPFIIRISTLKTRDRRVDLPHAFALDSCTTECRS